MTCIPLAENWAGTTLPRNGSVGANSEDVVARELESRTITAGCYNRSTFEWNGGTKVVNGPSTSKSVNETCCEWVTFKMQATRKPRASACDDLSHVRDTRKCASVPRVVHTTRCFVLTSRRVHDIRW